jgi:hypothetical protein
MHVQRPAPPVEIRRPEAEAIAAAYLQAAEGDARAALVQAIADALTDPDAAERRAAGQGRLIAHGNALGRVHG